MDGPNPYFAPNIRIYHVPQDTATIERWVALRFKVQGVCVCVCVCVCACVCACVPVCGREKGRCKAS